MPMGICVVDGSEKVVLVVVNDAMVSLSGCVYYRTNDDDHPPMVQHKDVAWESHSFLTLGDDGVDKPLLLHRLQYHALSVMKIVW